MAPALLLTEHNWLRPAANTVLLCIAVFSLSVWLGHYVWRKHRQSLATILFIFSIPWGFALALYAIDKTGLAEPYSLETSVTVPAQMEPKFQPESPGYETPFPTEHPRPTP